MNTAPERTEQATNSNNIPLAYTLTEFPANSRLSTSTASDFRPDFELALEEVRQRLETKTALLEEALQRFDRSEHRFWGINESILFGCAPGSRASAGGKVVTTVKE